MIRFKFNEEKTTQITAMFINKAGDKINYTKLIKLLYLTDREAFRLWERPLTGDSYVSMHKGPVLSKTYDLIDYEENPDDKSYWYRFISKENYDIKLIADPGFMELSKREIDLIERIYEKYKDKDWRQMIDICHRDCPEWKDPGHTSVPLPIEDTLRALDKNEDKIKTISEGISNLQYAHFVLCVNQ